jgi:collagenase-like PrtC family protease
VRAIKIEGRQRGRAYVTTALRRSIVANDWLSAATDVHWRADSAKAVV